MSSDDSIQAAAARRAPEWLVSRPLWQVCVGATLVAGVVAEIFGGIGRLLDVPMEAPSFGGDEAQSIFVGGFVLSTVFYGALATLAALAVVRWTSRPARTWLIVALVGLALSFFAPITAKDTETATKVVLSLSHVVVAAIMIPAITMRLAHEEGAPETPAPEAA